MIEVILFELISTVSLLFSLWLSFFETGTSTQVFLVYIWIVFASLIFALNYMKSRVHEISILLLLMPLIFYKDTNTIAFIVLVMIFMYLYMKKSLMEGTHNEYAYKIKRTYILCFLLGYLSVKIFGFDRYIRIALPFFIIYFISSLILLRTIRHIDSNMDMEKIRRSNIKYLVLMAIVFPLAASEGLRGLVWTNLKDILDKLLVIIYYPFYLIGSLIGKLTLEIVKELKKSVVPEISEGEEEHTFEELQELVEEAKTFDFTIFKIIFYVILFLIIAYIVYKLIMKTSIRDYSTIEYTEEREFIREPKKKRRRRWFFREKYPVDLREQIRFFYRKYLERLNRENVNILKSDTSLEINEKAREIFNSSIDDIRKIYIKGRYGNKEITEEDVDNIKNIYNNL